jgi:hypothetical protein
MGLDEIFDKCSAPKETNRQIGPLFKKWLTKGGLGIKPVNIQIFENGKDNAVLDASDANVTSSSVILFFEEILSP